MFNTQVANLIFFQLLPGVGSGFYWKLRKAFPSIKHALESPVENLRAYLPDEAITALIEHRQQGARSSPNLKVEETLNWAAENNVHLIHRDHENYPELLREIRRAPPLLYVKGDVHCLSLPQIGIVGSRKPSPAGNTMAKMFATDLADSGFVITSGLALGVDSQAHEGAVKVGGKTIAVLGTGIDKIYPLRNRLLAERIIESGGAIVSEFPIGTAALAQNFPQRNRIISGLSAGVLVVEAAIKSGSLITARYALQQNREVFAIPGSINNPLARGCHSLIKDGAKLVECSQDIVDELSGFLGLASEHLVSHGKHAPKPHAPSELEEIVLEHLDFANTSIDTLAQRCELSVGDIMSVLLTMELKGLVSSTGNGYMRIVETA